VLVPLNDTGNEQSLTEWEYIPPVGPRPVKGFVGLKNAGATCYMNSVTQQVFAIWLFLLIHLTQFAAYELYLYYIWTRSI